MQVSWKYLIEGYLPVDFAEKVIKDMGGGISLQGDFQTDIWDACTINETAVMNVGVTIIVTPFSCQLNLLSPVVTRFIDFSAVF